MWFRTTNHPYPSVMEHNTREGWDAWLAYATVIAESIISCTAYRKWMTNYLHDLWLVSANLTLSCMKFNSPVACLSLELCLYWCISERTEPWRGRIIVCCDRNERGKMFLNYCSMPPCFKSRAKEILPAESIAFMMLSVLIWPQNSHRI